MNQKGTNFEIDADKQQSSEGKADDAIQMQKEVLKELEDSQGLPGQPWYNLVALAVVLIVAIYAIIKGREYGLGTLTAPGAGMWPFAIGVVTAFVAIIGGLRFRKVQDTSQFQSAALNVIVGVAVMLIFWIFLRIVGFEIPSLIVCFLWLKVLGKESWRLSIVASVLIVAAFYIVFVVGLRVPLPRLI